MLPITYHDIVANHQCECPEESPRHSRTTGDDEEVEEWSGYEEEERHASDGATSLAADEDEEKDAK